MLDKCNLIENSEVMHHMHCENSMPARLHVWDASIIPQYSPFQNDIRYSYWYSRRISDRQYASHHLKKINSFFTITPHSHHLISHIFTINVLMLFFLYLLNNCSINCLWIMLLSFARIYDLSSDRMEFNLFTVEKIKFLYRYSYNPVSIFIRIHTVLHCIA